VYFLTELNPDDFLPESEGSASKAVLLAAKRCRVSSRCASKDRDSALVWADIQALGANDRAAGFKSLAYFVQIAQNGPPLTQHLDKKQVHEAHEFVSDVSGKVEKVWRYRRGDIRILFYYGHDRVLLLTDLLAKRSDKLEPTVLKRAELAVDAYLSATKANAILVVD
jgi:mRNA-degrading endonuclease RelE of RelBE toxin-antitoxin system